jgi:hypothetical protein
VLESVCAYCLQCLGHDLRAVVDGEDDICDTGGCKSLNLVLDHGLVRELDERLGQCEGLTALDGLVVGYRGAVEERTSGRRRVPKPPTRMMAMEHVSCAHIIAIACADLSCWRWRCVWWGRARKVDAAS